MADNESSETPNADAAEEFLRDQVGPSQPVDEEARLRVELVSLYGLAEQIRSTAIKKNIKESPGLASGLPDTMYEKYKLRVGWGSNLKPPKPNAFLVSIQPITPRWVRLARQLEISTLDPVISLGGQEVSYIDLSRNYYINHHSFDGYLLSLYAIYTDTASGLGVYNECNFYFGASGNFRKDLFYPRRKRNEKPKIRSTNPNLDDVRIIGVALSTFKRRIDNIPDQQPAP